MERSISGVGVLDKAVAILDALEAGPLTLAEVMAATALPRATAHRLVHALERHGLVARLTGDRRGLGPRLVSLGSKAMAGQPIAALARPALERLRDETGESVQLYLPQGDVRVCVASLESPHGLRTIVPVGAALPMDRGSAGKVLAGAADRATARRGWAASVEEREKGVASVSAPVHDGHGVAAAVSVSGPVGRMTRTPGRLHADAVVRAARAIEATLGWT